MFDAEAQEPAHTIELCAVVTNFFSSHSQFSGVRLPILLPVSISMSTFLAPTQTLHTP